MALQKWSAHLKRQFGDAIPRDYCCFDMETSGLKIDWDLPLEIGHVIVRDARPVHQDAHILNWADHSSVQVEWLEDRMARCREQMASKGQHYRFTIDLLRKEGQPPEKILEFYRKLFLANREAGAFFVGHNAWNFDSEMLCHCFNEYLGQEFEFESSELLDTGTLAKAVQLGILPDAGETMKAYAVRIRAIWAKGIRWNMDYCLTAYGLVEKHGLDLSKCHTAGFDAYACHLLFEENR